MTDHDLNRLYEAVIRQLRWLPNETDRLWFCSDWAGPTHFSRNAQRRIADLIVSHGGTVPPGYVWDDEDLVSWEHKDLPESELCCPVCGSADLVMRKGRWQCEPCEEHIFQSGF